MATINKTVKWTAPSGAAIEIKIEITKSVEMKTAYADGYNIELGEYVRESKEITAYINGEYYQRSSENPRIVEGDFYTEDYKRKVKAGGGYARLTDKVIINKEKYDLIMTEIEKAEKELEELFETENPEVVAQIKKVETEKAEKELEEKTEWANNVIAETEKRTTGILSEKEEAQWKKNYNNINNEGGEGYVPKRATLEDIELAKEILKEQANI